MSSYYIDTPFDRWLIFYTNENKIEAISLESARQGKPLSGYLKDSVCKVFKSRDFSHFDYNLLDISGLNEKQLRLHNFLISTKIGEVFYYSDLALTLFGDKRFARATARLLSINRYAFFVPCHRVIAKNGIGGYSKGVDLKKKILLWEGVKLNRGLVYV